MNYFLVWGIFFTVVITLAKTFIDHNKWADQKTINHKMEWWVMFFTSWVPGYLFGLYNTDLTSWMQIKEAVQLFSFWISFVSSGLMMAFFIFNFFPGLYNKFRGFSWWFPGSKDFNDSITEKYLKKYSPGKRKAIKLGGLAISIILYILTIIL